MRRFFSTSLVASVGAAALIFAPGASAHGAPDVATSPTPGAGSWNTGAGWTLGQSFVATSSGDLDAASVRLTGGPGASAAFVAVLRAADADGRGTGPVLATQDVTTPSFASGLESRNLDVDFAQPARVEAGRAYAFELYESDGDQFAVSQTTSPYANGRAYESPQDWIPDTDDLWLQTYVTPLSADAIVDSHQSVAEVAKWRKKMSSRKTRKFCAAFKGDYSDGTCGAFTKSDGPLEAGKVYRMAVSGQANVWGGAWDNGPCGMTKPEKLDDDEYAGADAAFTYSVPKQSDSHYVPKLGKLCKQLKADGPLRGLLQYSLDNGAHWQYFTPDGRTSVKKNHKYTKTVTGLGYAPQFRVPDIGPADNHGKFNVKFTEALSAR